MGSQSGTQPLSEASEVPGIFLVNTLILDPDVGTREVLAKAVGNRGHQVAATGDFDEAARWLAAGRYDCLVLKIRESWSVPLDQFLRYVLRGGCGALPHLLGVLWDDPPANPVDWIGRGLDDCVTAPAGGHHFDLRLTAVEKAILTRRQRAQWLADSVNASRNFENHFRNSTDALLIVTARDGLVLEASEHAGRVLGLSLAEIRERFLSLLLPGLSAQEDMTAAWNEATGPLRICDVTHRLPDGSLRSFDIILGRCNWSGRPALAVRIDDVTASRQTDEARTRVARMEAVRSVSAGAAQALNDALTSVRGNLDLLSKQNTARADARDLLDNAASACERAEDTVRTLANLARAGQTGSRRRLIDLRQFLPRAISFAALRGRLIPAFNLAEGLSRVEADESSLKEAVLALVENADQASKGVGKLEIGGWNLAPTPGQAPGVVIEFRDHGEGIPASHLSKLFDPYFTTRDGRQGLGLARALAIISAQGGTIEVESAPSEGSAFRVILPAAAGATPVSTPPVEPASGQPPHPVAGACSSWMTTRESV